MRLPPPVTAIVAILALLSGAAAAADEGPRSREIVSYVIQARLDPELKTIHGSERVTWTNVSRTPVSELQLHLYLNGFKNEKTTYMKESEGSSRGNDFRAGEWGWIDVKEMRLADGGDLLGGAEFIRPDDGNPDDETVMRVPLPAPVEPGGQIVFDAVFTSRLPQVFARTGYRRNFFLAGQWFPKLGVFEPAGMRGRLEAGWNCHQFHAHTEFYADFGRFDVAITVPDGYVVGATGALAGPPVAGEGGETTYRYVQDDVHDFAWTADPDFISETRTFEYARERDPVEERRMARILGLDGSAIPDAGATDLSGVPERIRLSDVEVTLLLHPEHRRQADRHFRAAFKALEYYGYWYGRYPYATLTVVDPAYGAGGAGGMEYPTFITAGARWVAPDLKHRPEGVTVHEAGHQFWYGLVANNEFEEAWLDEGINSYATGKVMEKVYGPDHKTMEFFGIDLIRFPLMSLPLDPRERIPRSPAERLERLASLRWAGAGNDPLLNVLRDIPFLTFPRVVDVPEAWDRRSRYLAAPKSDTMVKPSWEFYDSASYGRNAYSKAVLTLRTLETIIGRDNVTRALRLFHERWTFKHPTTWDFVNVVNEVVGRDMSWYFDQTLHGSDVLDYEIAEVSAKPVPAAAGVFGSGAERHEVTEEDAEAANAKPAGDGAERELNVVVRRLGEVRIPVQIELTFADGHREKRSWDGQGRWTRIREKVNVGIKQARILPAKGRPLDASWVNDARTAKPSRWPALKWWSRLVIWAQQVLYFYSGIA